jgi:CRP/FNR family cyclic AMP-dependent transcriptional regulator
LQKDQAHDTFFMIAKGEVEVSLKTRRCPDQIVTFLGPGQFFGEIELLNGVNSVATVRASLEQPVELVVLNRKSFLKVIEDSPLTGKAIGKVVQARLEQNRQLERSCR